MKKNCFKSVIGLALMVVGLALPKNASAQIDWNGTDADGNVWGHLVTEKAIISTNNSSSVTNKDMILGLWNVGSKKFLFQGGFWGTEAVLGDNPAPTHIIKNGTNYQFPINVTTVNYSTAFSTTGTANYRLGNVIEGSTKDDNGVYIDNAQGYTGNQTTATFSIVTVDEAKKQYAITQTVSGGIYYPHEDLGEGGSFYLYNRTGVKNQFLSVTSAGRVTVANSKPTFAWTIAKQGDGTYTIKNGNNYLYCNSDGALAYGNNPTSGYKWTYENGYFFVTVGSSVHYLTVDKSTVSVPEEAVRFIAATNETGTLYLDVKGGEGARSNVIVMKPYSSLSDIPETAKWKFINRNDFETAFNQAEATEAQPADATFFIDNADLARKGGSETAWTTANTGGYTRYGSSFFFGTPTSPNYKSDTGNDSSDGFVENTSITLGNHGNRYSITTEDVQKGVTNMPAGSKAYYQALYGGFFNGRIYGTTGSFTQNVTVTRTGWYKIGVYAYVHGDGTALLSATSKGNTTSVPVRVYDGNYDDVKMMSDAGIFLESLNDVSPYYITTLIYAEANSTIKINVSLTGGASTTVEFDRFRMYYTGDPENLLLLDENQTEFNYLAPQTTAEGKSTTMVLQRKLNTGVWNSLTLPVDMTGAQVRSAFGNGTRLCEYDKADGHIIYFKELDLTSDAGVAIKAGGNYLILPTDDKSQKTGSWKNTYRTGGEFSIIASNDAPVYVVEKIAMPVAPTANPAMSEDIHTTTDKVVLNFKGTYVNGAEVTPNSYIIAANNSSETDGSTDYYEAGRWYHWVGTSNLKTKGFRCWIGATTTPNESYEETVEEDAGEDENLDSKLIFVLGDFDSDSDATVIGSVTIDRKDVVPAAMNNKVYSIEGKLISNTVESLATLPKGIYVVNGKKFIVK